MNIFRMAHNFSSREELGDWHNLTNVIREVSRIV